MMLLCWSDAAYSSHCAPGQQFSCKPNGLWARGNHNLASQSPFPYLQSSSPLSRAWLSFSPCECSCAGSSILCYSPLSNLSCYWCLCYSKSFIWVTTSLPACSDPSFSLLIFHRRAFLKEINLRNLLHPLLWSGCSASPYPWVTGYSRIILPHNLFLICFLYKDTYLNNHQKKVQQKTVVEAGSNWSFSFCFSEFLHKAQVRKRKTKHSMSLKSMKTAHV